MEKNLSYFGGSHHYVISSVLLVGQVGLIHLQLGWEIYFLYKWDEPPSRESQGTKWKSWD